MACIIKSYKKNYIPEPDKDLKLWRQPDKRFILIDGDFAVMSAETYMSLQDYSLKYHSQCLPGKMCRHENVFYWFGHHIDPNKVSINYREIIIL